MQGFALLELGINQRLDELATTKAPDQVRLLALPAARARPPRLTHDPPHARPQAKHQKRLRAFRNAAREPLKALGVKLAAHGKKVGKERARFVAGVQDLTQFEAVRLRPPLSLGVSFALLADER